MAKSKYGKYYITKTPPNPRHPESRIKGNSMPWENTLYINNELDGAIKNAFYLETNMVLRKSTGEVGEKSHSHPFDEYLIFLGTDPDDLFDLHGMVEFWIGGEKHLITKSCAVFVPGGIEHCPLYFHRVDKPFMFVTTGNSYGYKHESDKAQ
jgi:mannose-6-phosphate isomerase-like protein (cupin superfamily)